MAVKKVSQFPTSPATNTHVFGRTSDNKSVQIPYDIKQTEGDSKTSLMSQKAITDVLTALRTSVVDKEYLEYKILEINNHNKGYFATLNDLNTLHPTGLSGDKAYVGTIYPYTIYYWDINTNSWITDGDTGGNEDVNLTNYYTKEETHSEIESYYTVLTKDEYDSITIKEDKFYFIYEEE